jgi:hypothetical protein
MRYKNLRFRQYMILTINIWPLSLTGPLLFVAACSGGGGLSSPQQPVNPPVIVNVPKNPAFETYVTDDTELNRVLADKYLPGDAEIHQQFEDSDPASPAGYRSIIELQDSIYKGDVRVEVIAQVPENGDDVATRLLRLTADQAQLEQVPGTTGRYFLRGDNFAWVTIDDGPLLSGSSSQGLENLVLDFDKGQADINLRTGVAGLSVVRTEIDVKGLPFDVRNGAFGGPITVTVHDPDSPAIYAIMGTLRGNVGGTPAYTDSTHGLSASGLYTAIGTSSGSEIRVDGAFAGIDPNALP